METKTLVDLNTAEQNELALVPGIGPVLAERIVGARPFTSFEDVKRVPGIGPSTLDKISPYATVEETLPVETESPETEVPAEGLSFVNIAPFEDEEEHHVAEIPADLIPLPPLPVVPPWDEATASVIAEEATTPEVVPPPLPETTAPSLAELPLPEAETPPPLPEMPAVIPPELPSPTEETPLPAKVVAPEPTVAPPPQAQAPRAERVPALSRPVTRAQLAWVSFTVFATTLIITLALTLGILAGINGGLSFASPGDVAQVSREVSALQGEGQALKQSLNSVQTRLNNLEAFGGRIQALETAKGDLQREVETLATQAKLFDTRIQGLQQETTTLNTQMERVQAQSERVQQVMDGLRDLLNSLFPEN